MKILQAYELTHISGAGVTSAIGTSCACLTGMAIGAVVGATLLDPTMGLIKHGQPTYFNSLKTQITDYVITYKYGHLGIDSKNDAVGALSGAIVGSVLGATLFALVS